MRVIKRYSEDLESERELRALSLKLSKYISEVVSKECVRMRNTAEEFYFKDTSWIDLIKSNRWVFNLDSSSRMLDKVYPSKYLKPFYEFMYESRDSVVRLISSDDDMSKFSTFSNGPSRGAYFPRTRAIYINCAYRFEEIIEFLKYGSNMNKNKQVASILLDRDFGNTLLHEFSHAYVDYISNSKVSYYKGKPEIDPIKNYTNIYLSDTGEINSFVSSVINDLEEYGIKSYLNRKDFWDKAKGHKIVRTYLEYYDTSDEVRSRFVGRIFRWYDDPPKGRAEIGRAINLYGRSALYYFDFNGNWDNFGKELERYSRDIFSRREIPSMKGIVDKDTVADVFKSDLMDLVNNKVPKKIVKNAPKMITDKFKDHSYLGTLLNDFVEASYVKGDVFNGKNNKIISFLTFMSRDMGVDTEGFSAINQYLPYKKFNLELVDYIIKNFT